MAEEEDRLEEIAREKAAKESAIVSLDNHNKAIENMRKQLRALEAAAEDVKMKNYHVRREVADLEKEEKALIGRIQLRQEQERQAAELLARMAELDELTADAIWRKGTPNSDGEIERIMDHQLYGAKFIATARKVICADEMGLGKSLESIASADMMQARRILFITPGEVMSGFLSEIRRWSKRPAIIIGRKPKKDVFAVLKMVRDLDKMKGSLQDIVMFVNYEAWSRNKNMLTMLEAMQFDMIVCDEAHKVKETDTSAFKGVDQIINSRNTCGNCGGPVANDLCVWNNCKIWAYGKRASVDKVLMLTGTPLLNRPTELYPLLNLIAPHIFSSLNQFIRMFCTNVSDDPRNPKYEFREGGFEALSNKIQGMYIRRTLEDTGIELPPQEVRVHEIDLDPEDYPKQYEIINMIRDHAQILIEEEGDSIDFMSQLQILTRMRQAAVWPGGIKIKLQERYPDGSPVYFVDPDTGETKPVMKEQSVGDHFRESVKLDKAMELLKEYVESGKRVVVFSQFSQVIIELLERLEHEGIRAVGYYGATPQADREVIKRNFDRKYGEEAKWDVVVAHYKTGGVGVNFTAAEHMILTDEEWNPGMEDQAMKRIKRIGQTEKTIVDILRLNDHIDVWLANLIASKRAMIENFNEKNEAYAELRKLLTKKPLEGKDNQ